MTTKNALLRHRSLTRSQGGNTALVVLAGIVVAIGIGVATWLAVRHRPSPVSRSTGTQAASQNAAGSSSPLAKPLSNGVDDASLNSDLQNVNSSLGQASQNLRAAAGAANDQQQAINVPTD